jgi:eukaryotic-like serine/threonine-protein kinase
MLIGSVAYISAEQALGNEADTRSDLYAVGCILYEMLSGSQPFTCDNPVGLLTKHASEEPAPLAGFRSDLPSGLEAVVAKAMAKNPDERYQSATELKNDLEHFLAKAPHPLLGSLKRFFHRS